MMAAAESAVYYPHHEGGRRSPMRIHDVAGKSAVCYPLHECAWFIAKRIQVQLYGHHECGMLNFECA